jgi:hypothetical protein
MFGHTATGMWQALGANAGFPDPFKDFSSLSMPTAWKSIQYWAEYVWNINGPYAAAHERIVSHFVTSLEINDVKSSEKEKWEELFAMRCPALQAVKAALVNRACYGNAWITLLTPFSRFLTCPRCASSWRINVMHEHDVFGLGLDGSTFKATCPRCKVGSGYTGNFIIDDRSLSSSGKFIPKIWSPHEIDLINDPWTGDSDVYWRIPEDYKNQLKQGPRGICLTLAETIPEDVLKACASNQHYKFDRDAIYHMKEPTLAGIINRGYGIPKLFRHFRQVWYLQVLRRYNEALAMDYVIPFRLITPAPRPGAGGGGMGGVAQDALASMNGGELSWHIRNMLQKRRFNPTDWFTLPFPVQYQRLGGDATELAPRDLMDQGLEHLLLSIGTPVELFKGTLSMGASVPALRLFASQHADVIYDANNFLRWIVRRVAEEMTWEKPDVTLRPVTIADDIERTMMSLQLATNQQISATSALRNLGYDWKEEQSRIMDEQLDAAIMQQEMQGRMDSSALARQIANGQAATGPASVGPSAGVPGGGGPPPQQGGAGGQAAPGGMGQGPVSSMISQGTMPETTDEVLSTAEAIANELLGLPEAIKDNELRLLRHAAPAVHAATKTRMEALRRGTRSQAGNAVLGQWQATGQPPQPQ